MSIVPFVNSLVVFAKAESLIITVLSVFFCSYHIAGSKGIYYSREPYSNVDAVHISRFIGLASVGNKDKQVWLFFFSIPLSDIDYFIIFYLIKIHIYEFL